MPHELLPILLATFKTHANSSSCPSAEAKHPLKVLNAKHVGAAGMVLLLNNTCSHSNMPWAAGLPTSPIPDAPPLWFLLLTSQISSLVRTGIREKAEVTTRSCMPSLWSVAGGEPRKQRRPNLIPRRDPRFTTVQTVLRTPHIALSISSASTASWELEEGTCLLHPNCAGPQLLLLSLDGSYQSEWAARKQSH